MNENQNAVGWFLDRHVNEGRQDKVVFREVDGKTREITYGGLCKRASQFAGALDRNGVRREERIAMIMLDQIEFQIAFWGSLKFGAIPVPINTLLTKDLYGTILDDCRASVLIVSKELWSLIKPVTVENKSLRTIITVGKSQDEAIEFEEFVKDATQVETVVVSGDESAFWLYSSGSTGAPKGTRHIHSSLKATAENYGIGVVGISENDIVYSAAKLFFAYGLGNAMSFPMSVGATTLLLAGRPTPESSHDIIKNHQPTVFCGVPTLYAAMNAYLEKTNEKIVSSLRRCISAGEALPREIGQKWEKLFGVEILDGVGSTEMLHIFLSNRPGDVEYGTSGIPVPGYQVKLVNEQNNEVADNELGEMLVNGPSSAESYWNQRQKSRDTFQGHWTRTGDKYKRTPEGRYIYCGRTDDMFKVSGNWLSPFEVEQALVEHPSIMEAAVVSWLDEDKLEKPKAFVVLKDKKDDLDFEELKEHVKNRIGLWKYPRWIELVDDLPKTATGKIQRFKLRQGIS